MKNHRLYKFLVIGLLAISFITANESFVYANNPPKKKLRKSSTVNMADSAALMQSAGIAVSVINSQVSATEADLEAIRIRVTTKINDLSALSTPISEILREVATIDKRSDRRNVLSAKLSELRAREAKLVQENRAIEAGMREASEKAETAMDSATASLVIGLIAGNIQTASAAAGFIGEDNRSGLAALLKRNTPTAPVEILEIIKVDGITLKIRIGTLTHCLSTVQKCSGKQYSVSK